ncbi:MAG: heavy metal translocating P-type ATPase, partial [Alphaproteobacteria bacterium]|nr:heavy metal translocating P-type ATPase [Alphaproteobacteria bacterium]
MSLVDVLPRPVALTASCRHCGGATASGAAYCCAGCRGAHDLIAGLGLARFYDLPGGRGSRPEPQPAESLAAHVRALDDGTKTLDAVIDGLVCPSCVWLIESALGRRPEVVSARVNLTTGRLSLRCKGDVDAVLGLLPRLGYRLRALDEDAAASAGDAEDRKLLRALAVAGFAAGNIMLLSVSVWSGAGEMGAATRDLLHWLSALIALPAIAYAGQPFFGSALAALRAGRANMDVPISIGVTLAAAISLAETLQSRPHAYFDSAVTLLFFLLIGRYLDRRARGRARDAATRLAALEA